MNRPKTIFQDKIKWVKISELKMHPENPRVDLREYPEQYKKLQDSLKKGLFEPIKVGSLSGYCLAGHQRLKVFEDAGYDEAPVLFVDCTTEKEEIEIMITDNNEFGFYDYTTLKNLGEKYDLKLDPLGLSEADKKELERVCNLKELDDKFELSNEDKQPFTQISFILTDEQAEKIKEALDLAKEEIAPDGEENKNSSGNALHLIADQWLAQRI